MSSEAYERERQNNTLLDSLSSKVSQLRSVTDNIYSNARDHELIEANDDSFHSFGTNLRNSAGRLTRMAGQGNRVAILKLAGILAAVVLVVWWVGGWVLGLFFGGGKGDAGA